MQQLNFINTLLFFLILGLSSPDMIALMIGSPGQPEQPMKRLKPECDNNLSIKWLLMLDLKNLCK